MIERILENIVALKMSEFQIKRKIKNKTQEIATF